jgi:protein transport protein SEC61 subunit gamma and related proteins
MAIDLTKVDVPSFKIPSPKEWPAKLKKTLKEWRRVFKITKKPGKEEYLAVVKVTGLGILVIGAIGFAIFLVVELMK